MISSIQDDKMRSDSERSSIRERFLAVDTATVADVLDEAGFLDQGLSPDIVADSGQRLAGWCYTIAGQMGPYEGTGEQRKMKACEGIGRDEISVWSGDGQGICYFGELIAVGMIHRGSVGSLVDGGVRDVRWLRELGFPVFARYRSSVQSIGRWRVTDWQVPVYVRGATSQWVAVRPGDFILADEDGAVVVSEELVEDVLAKAEAMTETEVGVRKALQEGVSLEQALDQLGQV
jgi:4-hydroxy-4-methyl-2-oxoglutarate aldolase